MPKSKQVAEANEAKELGNQCMKAGNHAEAILRYTISLKCDPDNHLVHSNRSLALLKEQQYYLAMEDAKKCIELQPKWPKGYFRKGEIEFQAGHYSSAFKSYRQALILDSSDEGIKSAVSRASRELNRAKKADARLPWSFTAIGALLGIIVVLGDEYLTNAPTLRHFVLKIAFVGICGTVGVLAARGYRFMIESQRNSLLEPPPDLFQGDGSTQNQQNSAQNNNKPSSRKATGSARQRAKKTTTI